MNVIDFLNSVRIWQKSYPDICPRCGGPMRLTEESEYSHIILCYDCFMDEHHPSEENFDNWAVLVAVRDLCGANIKF